MSPLVGLCVLYATNLYLDIDLEMKSIAFLIPLTYLLPPISCRSRDGIRSLLHPEERFLGQKTTSLLPCAVTSCGR